MDTSIGNARLKWLKSNDKAQMQWVRRYLLKNGNTNLPLADTDLIAWLESQENNADYRESIGLMSAAWRQKKYRDQNSGRKPYSFHLPTSAQATLKKLAFSKRLTITAVLEQIISEALEDEKHHTKELRALKKEHKGMLDKAKESSLEKENKISELGNAAKKLGAEVSKLSKELCELQLRAKEISPLTEEDEAAMNSLYKEELEKIEDRLALPKGLDAFNSRPYIYKPSKTELQSSRPATL